MNLKQKSQSGFSVVEALLILVIVGMLGFTGWYVWHSKQVADKTLTADNSSTPAPQVTAYNRTTTIPSDWKTYTNSVYKFTASYPADWHVDFNVINKKVGEDTQNDYSLNATKIGVLCYLLKGEQQTCDGGEINIQNQSLKDSVNQLNKAIKTGGNEQVLSQKYLTLDGHQAFVIRSKQQSSPVTVQYFVYANGNTYAMPTVYETDNQNTPVSAKDSLMLFEAIKIQ